MRPRGRWSPFALAILCAHCSLSLFLAAFALVGGGSLAVLGVDLNYIWPPVVILGAFAWLLWSGREKEGAGEACERPHPRD